MPATHNDLRLHIDNDHFHHNVVDVGNNRQHHDRSRNNVLNNCSLHIHNNDHSSSLNDNNYKSGNIHHHHLTNQHISKHLRSRNDEPNNPTGSPGGPDSGIVSFSVR